MTYKKIAQLAGVSVSTVSKAMSGSQEIGRETAERIRKIAEENRVRVPRYYHNSKDMRVAIVVPEIISVFYSQTVTDIIRELDMQNIEACVYISGFDRDESVRQLTQIAEGGTVDGIISLSSTYPKPAPVPIIGIGVGSGQYEHRAGDVIGSDTLSGIREAVDHLRELGHTRIGFAGEKNTTTKRDMFCDVMAHCGLTAEPRHIFTSDKRFEEIGYEAAEYFMHMRSRPTAILTAYDEIALGAIHTFRCCGISVPDDISIIGMNDIPAAAYANPPLTTITSYREERARIIVRHLLDRIEHPDNNPIQHIILQCSLIVRQTTAGPHK